MAILKYRIATGWCTFLASLFVATTVAAQPLPLWELDGANSRVLIMGSVHFLRPSDYPLRAGLEAAYQQADNIVMEINMGELDPLAAQETVAGLSIDPEGRSLQQFLGNKDYAKADHLAADLGIPLALFAQFEPWFAALSITQLRMTQLGFDPAWGIESMLTRKALAEGKTLDGLETIGQQLSFMDQLDEPTQKLFLLQSLEEAASVQDEVETIVQAWRTGDIATLENALLKGLDENPALYDAILVQRNKNWVRPIRELLQQPGNHLVVVGAMHLIGEDSVLTMLEEAGLHSRQLSDADFSAAP